jgi:hypothetical protein
MQHPKRLKAYWLGIIHIDILPEFPPLGGVGGGDFFLLLTRIRIDLTAENTEDTEEEITEI